MIKTKFLIFSALLTSSAFLSACSPIKADGFCDVDNPCDMGFECNLATNGCEAEVVQADAGGEVDADVVVDIDAAPAVCEGGNHCVAEVPADWVGPLVYTTAATMDDLDACPAAYMDEVAVLGNEMTENAACSCSCGDISNPTCNNAKVIVNNTATCPGNLFCQNGSCEDIFIPPFSTAGASSHIGDQVQASFGTVNGGTCASAVTDSEFTSSFGAVSRLCQSTPLNAACGDSETCAPQVPNGFVPQQCIAREGEFECPSTGPYTEQTVLYAEIDDQRSCDSSACVCNTTNVNCGGRVAVQTQSPIMGNAPIEYGATPGCFTVPSISGIQYGYRPNDNIACRLNGAAVVSGAATPTGATTLCCEPAL